jgi:hypothetical protein
LNLDLLIQSGAVVHDPSLDAFLGNPMGGQTVTVRQLSALADIEPNISSDDPGVLSTPNKLGGVTTNAVRQSLNQSWSEMDLAVDLYGSDPLGVVQSQIAKYWISVRQRRVLAAIKGLIADSYDNHGGDLIIDKIPSYAEMAPSNLISAEAIIDAATLMGDRAQNLKGLAVHSVVFSTMQKLNLIQTERLSDLNIFVYTYLGYPVIVDDNLTVEHIPEDVEEEFPAYDVYYSYLFGYGAFAFGVGSPKTPFEVIRTAAAGNGGGQETVFHRVEWVLHPQGYTTNVLTTPTIAQLQDLATWIRVWDRKRIPISVIRTRG